MFKAPKLENKQAGSFIVAGRVKENPQIRLAKSGLHYLNVGLEFERDGTTMTAYGPVMLEGPASFKLSQFFASVGLPANTEVDKGERSLGQIPGHNAIFMVGPGETVDLKGRELAAKVEPQEYNGTIRLNIVSFIVKD